MSIASLFHLQLLKFITEADVQEFINKTFSFCILPPLFDRDYLFLNFFPRKLKMSKTAAAVGLKAH